MAALLAAAVALSLPGAAAAAQHQGAKPAKPAPTVSQPPAPPAASTPPAGQRSGAGAPIGGSPGGIADNTIANGGGDPLCNNLTVLSLDAQQNCHTVAPDGTIASSGTPESLYPIGNYGLDVHVDTSGFLGIGGTSVGGDAASFMQNMISDIFGVIERVVSLAILAISLAFGFSLWDSDRQGQIPAALDHVESLFTSPLLAIALVIAGIIAISQLVLGRHGRALGGIVAMVLMLIGTLIVMQDPKGTLGWFDSFTNQTAQFSVGAVSGHPSASAPTSSYASATEGLWQAVGEEPWCDMEFGDVGRCTAPLTQGSQLVSYVRTVTIPALRQGKNSYSTHIPEPQAQQAREIALLDACLSRIGHQAQQPCTLGQLFLAFPTGDDARNGIKDHWTLYHWLDVHAPSLMSIRQNGGLGDRLAALFFTTVAMFFFLLLLFYIAINLLLAGISFVILLLLSGVMALIACFGEWGRQKWLQWGVMLLGSLSYRMLFAIYLGIMILASTLMREIAGTLGGWEVQWLLYTIFWWQAWANRNRLLELFTGRHTQHEHHPGLTAAAVFMGARVAHRSATRPLRPVADRINDAGDRWRVNRDRRELEAEHREAVAQLRQRGSDGDNRLNERARQKLDVRYDLARATVAAGDAQEASAREHHRQGMELRYRRERAAAGGGVFRAQGGGGVWKAPASGAVSSQNGGGFVHARGGPSEAEQQHFMEAQRLRDALRDDHGYQQARRFLTDADEHERQTGRRYTPGQIAEARAAVEREIHAEPEQRDYEQLAYRLGPGGAQTWKDADPEKRDALRQRIDEQIAQDRHAHQAVQNMPRRLEPPRPQLPPPPHPRHRHQYLPPRRRGELIGAERNMRRPPLVRP